MLRYFFNSGMGEGWALYSERLADELGLYSGDIDRIGMLSNEALRAARLVVDPGMHTLGWSRRRALDYMLAHTAESESAAAWEIDRYIALPAQSTAWMTQVRGRAPLARADLGGPGARSLAPIEREDLSLCSQPLPQPLEVDPGRGDPVTSLRDGSGMGSPVSRKPVRTPTVATMATRLHDVSKERIPGGLAAAGGGSDPVAASHSRRTTDTP